MSEGVIDIPSPLLSDRAYEAIRDKIVSLEIAPGAPIEEGQQVIIAVSQGP